MYITISQDLEKNTQAFYFNISNILIYVKHLIRSQIRFFPENTCFPSYSATCSESPSKYHDPLMVRNGIIPAGFIPGPMIVI